MGAGVLATGGPAEPDRRVSGQRQRPRRIIPARLVAALGAQRVDQLLPLPDGRRTTLDSHVDLAAITYVVPDALRRIGTPPFFLTLHGQVSDEPRPDQRSGPPGGHEATPPPPSAPGGAVTPAAPERRLSSGVAWAISAAKSATGAPMLAVSSYGRFDIPSARYLVHLSAPGWNLAGATSPWLPGVVIGHNDRIAWAMVGSLADTQDIFIERVNPRDTRQVQRGGRWVDMAVDHERVDVLGRAAPVEFDRLYTANGVVIAQDRERNLVYTLRWSGTEPGGAGELAALAVGRATSWNGFRAALSHWKTPVEFVYADVDGHIGRQQAGLAPVRPSRAGSLPTSGWSSDQTWAGFTDLSASAGALDPSVGFVLASGTASAQRARINEVLTPPGARSATDTIRLLNDIRAWNASQLVPLLKNIRALPNNLESIRNRLARWDGTVDAESADSALYITWEEAIRRLLADKAGVPAQLFEEFVALLDPVILMTHPTAALFPGDVVRGRDMLLVDALSRASASPESGQRLPRTASFEHPLAVFEPAKRRFNIGPFPQPGYAGTSLRDRPSPRPVLQRSVRSESLGRVAGGQPAGTIRVTGEPPLRRFSGQTGVRRLGCSGIHQKSG